MREANFGERRDRARKIESAKCFKEELVLYLKVEM
jgi:hypothetical protein